MGMKIVDPKVAAAFNVFPPVIRKKLMRLRMLIFDVADETEGEMIFAYVETVKFILPGQIKL